MHRHLPFILLSLLVATSPTYGEDLNVNTLIPMLWEMPKDPLVGGLKLINLMDRRLAARLQRPKQPIIADNCTRRSPASDFLNVETFQGKSTAEPVNVPVALLAYPAEQVNDLFNVMRTTKLGRAVVEKFIPIFGTGIAIRHMTEKDQLVAPTALAYFRVDEKAIYINKKQERGRVAFILLHEIVHSLDKESQATDAKLAKLSVDFYKDLDRTVNATAYRNSVTSANLMEDHYSAADLERLEQRYAAIQEVKDVMLFQTERLAHDASFTVWNELAAKYPSYYKKPKSRAEEALLRRRPAGAKSVDDEPWYFDDEKIIRTSNLNGHVIDKLKAGTCVPLAKVAFGK